jgi:hypothetical protein
MKSAMLLDDIQAFCRTHGLSISKFGELALNDKPFVHELMKDPPRRIWPETEAKVRRFMATYRPDAEETRLAS